MSTPPSCNPALPAKDGLVAAYEELRRQLLNGQRGAGLALFMRGGMREWMNACSLCTVPASTKVLAPAKEDEVVLPQLVHSEVVLILVGMLLHGQEARP